ncbi:hypothetical protein KC347_g10 [Hortaea werneckii]|nr:hypothetical protein KC347_g10 [Hortaea werneckii]
MECAGFVVVRGWEGIGVVGLVHGLNLTTCSAHNDHSRYRSTSKRDTVTLSSSLLLLSCGNLFAFFSPPSQCMLLNDTVAFEQERCSVVRSVWFWYQVHTPAPSSLWTILEFL